MTVDKQPERHRPSPTEKVGYINFQLHESTELLKKISAQILESERRLEGMRDQEDAGTDEYRTLAQENAGLHARYKELTGHIGELSRDRDKLAAKVLKQ